MQCTGIDVDQKPSLIFDYVAIAVKLARASRKGGCPMDDHVISRAEGENEIFTFDVSDDALERAASAEQQATTWVYCIHPWYYCPWPQ